MHFVQLFEENHFYTKNLRYKYKYINYIYCRRYNDFYRGWYTCIGQNMIHLPSSVRISRGKTISLSPS